MGEKLTKFSSQWGLQLNIVEQLFKCSKTQDAFYIIPDADILFENKFQMQQIKDALYICG